jgi:ribosomal protein S14
MTNAELEFLTAAVVIPKRRSAVEESAFRRRRIRCKQTADSSLRFGMTRIKVREIAMTKMNEIDRRLI